MKAIDSNTTIVVTGAFNTEIFRPNWIAVHGLGRAENEQFEVEMLAPISGGPAPTKFTFFGFSYSIGSRRFVLHLEGCDVETSTRFALAVAEMFGKLPHTPITGLGFNYSFRADRPDALQALAGINGPMVDCFEGESEVVARKWSNSVKWGNALVAVNCDLDGEDATISLNFHYSASSVADIVATLREPNIFSRQRDLAARAASALSGEQLEA